MAKPLNQIDNRLVIVLRHSPPVHAGEKKGIRAVWIPLVGNPLSTCHPWVGLIAQRVGRHVNNRLENTGCLRVLEVIPNLQVSSCKTPKVAMEKQGFQNLIPFCSTTLYSMVLLSAITSLRAYCTAHGMVPFAHSTMNFGHGHESPKAVDFLEAVPFTKGIRAFPRGFARESRSLLGQG
jgi:hypothetical protein